MTTATDYRITKLAQLRAIIGEPGALVPHKLLKALDEPMVEFIGRSPFLVLATADAAGNQDASPKGDAPGFVAIENRRSLLIPDRKGNKLVFSLQNILANPHVGLIFMVPGTDETLRVNGTAELTVEPEVLKRLAARGADAQLAIRLTIRECFFHCAKAFMRSQLWRPESWSERVKISWGDYLASKTGADAKTARQIDQFVEQDYKNNL
ncbi:MAG TPA: MSMEG_1061 family FMN-dependent PPOX-type flavoprotein [Candidatus Binataceae bacterium]|nr:MSMEG_1061 family FMN-dependent PPOX-type flavoprotein [Candidatus Binataceae bacterium]